MSSLSLSRAPFGSAQGPRVSDTPLCRGKREKLPFFMIYPLWCSQSMMARDSALARMSGNLMIPVAQVIKVIFTLIPYILNQLQF